MKKTLLGLACVFALLMSCKEKTPENKILDGTKEIQEGTSKKAKEIEKKANNVFKNIRKDIKNATSK